MIIHKLPSKKTSPKSFEFFKDIFLHYRDVSTEEKDQTIHRLVIGKADGFFIFEYGLLGIGEFELHPWGIGYWIHFLFKDPVCKASIPSHTFSKVVSFIESYAKINGATATYFYGRPAWSRLLNRNGYSISSFYTKEL